MPCHVAVTKKHQTIDPDMSVEKALKFIRKNKVITAPVVDGEGKILGLFSMKILLKNLIPVSVVMADGVQIDIKVTAAPGVAKRLNKILPLPVSEVMERKVTCVDPDAPLWEGVSLITRHGSPIAVVDKAKKLVGLMTYDSLVETLEEVSASET